METKINSAIDWGKREKTAGVLLTVITASLIGAELILYAFINVAWEINLVFAILLVLGGLIGIGNARMGSIILTLIGLLLLTFGILYTITGNNIFFLYTPWFFIWGRGFSLEGILSLVSALLILDGNRREV